jgi:hypothetical protein
MKYIFTSIIIFGFLSSSSSQIHSTKFQLAQPAIIYDEIYYSGNQKISMGLDFEGASIYYTTDGSVPTIESESYITPFEIEKSTVVKAIATHPDCVSSDVASVEFVKMVEFPALATANSSNELSSKYRGKGVTGLVDKRKGSLNFSDGRWIGIEGNDYQLTIEFNRSVSINKIIISSLSSPGSWIFPPVGATFSESSDGKNFFQFSEIKYGSEISAGESKFAFLKTDGPHRKVKYIKINIKSTGVLPEWHPGKGSKAWLFLDEIFFE